MTRFVIGVYWVITGLALVGIVGMGGVVLALPWLKHGASATDQLIIFAIAAGVFGVLWGLAWIFRFVLTNGE